MKRAKIGLRIAAVVLAVCWILLFIFDEGSVMSLVLGMVTSLLIFITPSFWTEQKKKSDG